MKQYLDLLHEIKNKGTHKPPAREGMPSSQSLFGYQFRHNLQDGFPLLTTKKMFWKGVVVELLWFLRGDTNIKYLLDNGVNLWNEDAYNYYCKKKKELYPESTSAPMEFEVFIDNIKKGDMWAANLVTARDQQYKLGDCGYQYGKVWRQWNGISGDTIKINTDSLTQEQIDKFVHEWRNQAASSIFLSNEFNPEFIGKKVDQIKNLIEGLKKNPESRRHILTAIDPAHDTELALYWCHVISQFNCRPLTLEERIRLFDIMSGDEESTIPTTETLIKIANKNLDENNIPKYYLDCQLYQRSADMILGVPFNIASYALLTEILAKICNMVAGDFIHTFGDAHIYENHKEAVEEQLSRTPTDLPKLVLGNNIEWNNDIDKINTLIDLIPFKEAFDNLFKLENYNPQPAIKAKLSTGLKK